MKTIYTTLPIYDTIGKQCYQRSKKVAKDQVYAIIYDTGQLPGFQWSDNGDGANTVSRIDLIDLAGNLTDITSYLTTLPVKVTLTTDSYFVCNGELSTDIPVGIYYLKITMNNSGILYSELFTVKPNCSGDLSSFNFYNNCDFYNILYQTGFQQYLYLNSETVEPSIFLEEEGIKNGQGLFIRTFARQTKKYTIRSIFPDYMVDVLNRMKLHDTIMFTNQFGEVNEVINLDVTHEWLNDDRYYAMIEIVFDFDETVVISGCCNNIV